MGFVTEGHGWFDVKSRPWVWQSRMFSRANTSDVYRESFIGALDEVIEPYDWCVQQFGPNWGTWGSKIITLFTYKTIRGAITGLYDLRCEFHFTDKDDFALFKLSWAN